MRAMFFFCNFHMRLASWMEHSRLVEKGSWNIYKGRSYLRTLSELKTLFRVHSGQLALHNLPSDKTAISETLVFNGPSQLWWDWLILIYAPEFKAGEFLHSKDFFTVDKSNISVPSWSSRIWNDFFDNKQQKAKLSDCQRERTAILTFYDPRIHYFGGPLGRLISTIQGKHKRNWISSPFLSKLRNILLRPTTWIVFVDL